jgi:hypothetical protein
MSTNRREEINGTKEDRQGWAKHHHEHPPRTAGKGGDRKGRQGRRSIGVVLNSENLGRVAQGTEISEMIRSNVQMDGGKRWMNTF